MISKLLSGKQAALYHDAAAALAKGLGVPLEHVYRAIRATRSQKPLTSIVEKCVDGAKHFRHNI